MPTRSNVMMHKKKRPKKVRTPFFFYLFPLCSVLMLSTMKARGGKSEREREGDAIFRGSGKKKERYCMTTADKVCRTGCDLYIYRFPSLIRVRWLLLSLDEHRIMQSSLCGLFGENKARLRRTNGQQAYQPSGKGVCVFF